MLPGDAEVSERITCELSKDLQIGSAPLSVCISIIEERQPTKPLVKEEFIPYRVGNALCIKACKTYRSVLILSQYGAADDATILGRTLFETTLAVLFVLRPTVTLGIKGCPDKDLTSDLRAKIYSALQPIAKYRELLKHSSDLRFAQVMAAIDFSKVKAAADRARAEIGPFWTNRLEKSPYTYSGFRLPELAEKLDPDLSHWYARMYGEQSKPAHAVDAHRHVQWDKVNERMIAKWHSSLWDTQQTLLVGGALLCRCLTELNGRFRFEKNSRDGIETDHELLIAMRLLEQIEKGMTPSSTEPS